MRRTFVVVLVVLLAGTWSTTTTAGANEVTVRMAEPRLVDTDTAELTGRANRPTVQIQRQTSIGARWLTIRWVRTDDTGRYRTQVAASTTPRRYRAVVGGVFSRARTVVALPVVINPQEPEVPDDPAVPDPPVEPPVEPPLPPVEPPLPPVEPPLPPVEPPLPPVEPPVELSDACGPRPLKADGSRWSCTLAEDFDGDELDRSVWMPQTIFRSGDPTAWACYLDDPSVIAVHDGVLDLTVRKLAASAPCAGQKGALTPYVSGMVTTYHRFSQQYGRFEARIKSTATRAIGLQESFWLWPDDRYSTGLWPAAGEIDIAETYSQYPDLAVPFLHYTAYDNWGPVPGLNTAWNCVAKRGEYNTYALEWTAARLEIKVNGRTCLVNTSADPAFQKRYIVSLTQLLGVGANTYDGRAPMPATMTVDYVRVWR